MTIYSEVWIIFSTVTVRTYSIADEMFEIDRSGPVVKREEVTGRKTVPENEILFFGFHDCSENQNSGLHVLQQICVKPRQKLQTKSKSFVISGVMNSLQCVIPALEQKEFFKKMLS